MAAIEPQDLRKLVQLLKTNAAKWKRLGLQLGVQQSELNIIQSNHRNSPDHCEECLTELLDKWLRQTPEASYKQLVKALANIGEHVAAKKLGDECGIAWRHDTSDSTSASSCNQQPSVVVNVSGDLHVHKLQHLMPSSYSGSPSSSSSGSDYQPTTETSDDDEFSGTDENTDEDENTNEASMDNKYSMLSGGSMDVECQEGSKDDDYDVPVNDGKDSMESDIEETLRSVMPVRKESDCQKKSKNAEFGEPSSPTTPFHTIAPILAPNIHSINQSFLELQARNKELQSKVEALTTDIQSREIAKLQSSFELRQKEKQLQQKAVEVVNLRQKLQCVSRGYEMKLEQTELAKLEREIPCRDEKLKLDLKIENLQAARDELQSENDELQQYITYLEEENKSKAKLERDISNQRREIDELQSKVEAQTTEFSQLQTRYEAKSKEIAKLQSSLETQTREKKKLGKRQQKAWLEGTEEIEELDWKDRLKLIKKEEEDPTDSGFDYYTTMVKKEKECPSQLPFEELKQKQE